MKHQDRNFHHLFPRCRFAGKKKRKRFLHKENKVLIKVQRHTNWHKMWGERTLLEIIQFLGTFHSFHYHPLWVETFGNKTTEHIRILLIRLARAKHYEKVEPQISSFYPDPQ